MALMDPSSCEEEMYDTSYDVDDHSNSTDANVPSLSEEETQRVDKGKEFVDVIELEEDASELSHLWAQEFYSNYAKKLGFVTRIRNTNFDKSRKESMIPINQSIHYNCEGYRESQVKVASRVRKITTARCRARMYVMFDRELTMHAKCVIQDNDEASIRPNKTYLTLANEVGGSSNLGYLEKDVRNFITSNLHYADEKCGCQENDELFHSVESFKKDWAQFIAEFNLEHNRWTFMTIIECGFESILEFQREYTISMFREIQQKFKKKGNCLVCGVTQEGDLVRATVDEQYILYGEPRVDRVPSCYVLPQWRKNVQHKHTFIKSSHDEKRFNESHNLFRGLCSHFFNVAQDFVTCEEEAAMLHSGFDELTAKLFDYRAKLGFKSVPTIQNSIVLQCDPARGASDIQGPSKVATKGRSRVKRLGFELDTSIKKSK
ncbi:hypothetical protein Ahy_B09g098571 [Arachis hypogaea]|uniref:Protein FAR1-RELATED SEQUENCE n=1 Tax=Arachis hypogaea TaxID=3818 RepID=A0A444XRJ0_ARAHY|nr:hypothetical protein Ahy_B09g098571 [Arachis hypogaea]